MAKRAPSVTALSSRTLRAVVIWSVTLLIFGFAALLIVRQWSSFQQSLEVLRESDLWLGIAAFGCIALAVAGGALVYRYVALRRATYGSLLAVSWAGMLVNRLLPAGVGGIGLFVDYFLRRGHKPFEASGVVALSGILTLLGHVALLCIVLGFGLTSAHISLSLPAWAPAVVLIVVALLLFSISMFRGQISTRVKQWRRELQLPFSRLIKSPRSFALAQSGALLNTLSHAGALYLAMLACGLDLSLADALVVLAGGVLAATASPTPGGLVGAEAGLTGAMVLFGAHPTDALAAALLYRLVSYWIPLFFGAFALVLSRRKGYI